MKSYLLLFLNVAGPRALEVLPLQPHKSDNMVQVLLSNLLSKDMIRGIYEPLSTRLKVAKFV